MAAAPGCTTGQLRLSLGHPNGAAGTTYTPIILTNTGSAACATGGYPGVSFTDASGHQIGPSSKREGGPTKTITLAPGDSASTLLSQSEPGNSPSAHCVPKTASRIRVYPPNQTAALLISHRLQVCSTSTGRTEITPLQAGSNPQ